MSFFQQYQGEFFALLTAIFWTITALAFESASLKVGSLSVNIIRLFLAMIFLCAYTFVVRGRFFPGDASLHSWVWLSLSGLIGFVLGDLFLFKSYTIIGSRFSMLIMSLVPPMAAFFGWIILGEKLKFSSLIGIFITVAGISMAIFARPLEGGRIKLKLAPKGILYAFAGALGQALGLVLSKLGMQDYDSFASNQIRIITGIVGFSILVTILGRWKRVFEALTVVPAMKGIVLGSFFGPFLGVSFSLLSVVHTKAGIASTIMAMVPVLIIAPAVLIFKQKINWMEALGAVISVGGVSLFFIG
jgi:drug/metabolite transporter (DMT)-like permease